MHEERLEYLISESLRLDTLLRCRQRAIEKLEAGNIELRYDRNRINEEIDCIQRENMRNRRAKALLQGNQANMNIQLDSRRG